MDAAELGTHVCLPNGALHKSEHFIHHHIDIDIDIDIDIFFFLTLNHFRNTTFHTHLNI